MNKDSGELKAEIEAFKQARRALINMNAHHSSTGVMIDGEIAKREQQVEVTDLVLVDPMPTLANTTSAPSKPQSKSQQDELDEILSQAFTDGASDTMWQNDRHVEIYATAKARLQSYIDKAVAQEVTKARIDELEIFTQFNDVSFANRPATRVVFMDRLEERIAQLTAQNKDKA